MDSLISYSLGQEHVPGHVKIIFVWTETLHGYVKSVLTKTGTHPWTC